MTDKLSREHLVTFVFDPHCAAEDEVREMARELMAARARVAELEAVVDSTAEFINQRPEYVHSCRNANANSDHDYYRWQGGAEARRQLAQRLGWTVPYELGEKTTPKEAEQ